VVATSYSWHDDTCREHAKTGTAMNSATVALWRHPSQSKQ